MIDPQEELKRAMEWIEDYQRSIDASKNENQKIVWRSYQDFWIGYKKEILNLFPELKEQQ